MTRAGNIRRWIVWAVAAAALAVASWWVAPAGGQCVGGSCGVGIGVGVDLQGWRGGRPDQASPATPAASIPAVGRIVVSLGGAHSLGSATVVDLSELGVEADEGTAYVLSCHHVFADGGDSVVHLQENGQWQGYTATVVVLNKSDDLSLLKIQRPPCRPLKLASVRPIRGAALWVAGWGGGSWRAARSQATGYWGNAGENRFDMVVLGTLARNGDSGGAILDTDGNLVGVVTVTNGRICGGTCGERIAATLRTFFRGRRDSRVAADEMAPLPQAQPATVPPASLPPVPPAESPSVSNPSTGLPPLDIFPGTGLGDSTPIIPAATDEPKPEPSILDTAASAVGDLTSSGPTAGWLTAAATALGFAAPPAAVVGVGAWLAKRWWSKRKAKAATTQATVPQAATPQTPRVDQADIATAKIRSLFDDLELRLKGVLVTASNAQPATDTSQPATETKDEPLAEPPLREVEYVPVEITDRRIDAMERALDEYAQKFPGSRSAVDTIRAYAAQIYSGLPERFRAPVRAGDPT